MRFNSHLAYKRIILLMAATVILLVAAYNQTVISKQKARKLAEQEMVKQKMGPLKNYAVSISADTARNLWLVSFTGIGRFARPGYHALVRVNKKTGEVQFDHGE